MPDPTEPSEILRQIAEHLRLESAMGGDWVPVSKPANKKEKSASPARPAKKAPASKKEGGGKTSGLDRIENAVRSVEPETIEANSVMLEAVATEIAKCKRCALCKSRNKTVPGDGHAAPRLVFVGEGPGRDEDIQGIPFVGRAGQLLGRMIGAIGLKREEVFIMNTVKCRPPGNRTPEPGEMEACSEFLERQLAILQPEIIVALGRPASQSLLSTNAPISRLRGRWQDREGVRVMPTFHPAYLLRNVAAKKDAWEDLQMVHQFLTTGSTGDDDEPEPVKKEEPEPPPQAPQGKLFG